MFQYLIPSELFPSILRQTTFPPITQVETFAKIYIDSLLTVTHVCRDWRFYALNSPSLWTYIVPMRKHRGFMLECICRAANAPLRITYDSHAKPDFGEGGIKPRWDRVVDFQVIAAPCFFDGFSSHFEKPWDSLESMFLSSSGDVDFTRIRLRDSSDSGSVS